MNAPDRHELFILGDDERKVTYVDETRVPNATLFTFNKEDHTLANLLADKLRRSPNILYAAYKVPHPLFAKFELRVQTDGSLHPKEAVIKACTELVAELAAIDKEFRNEYTLKKIAMGEDANANPGVAGGAGGL